MPNGADPHEWEPSAKDIETLTKADLLVENGLGLEGGMGNAFEQAEAAGVRRFVASDHMTIRRVGSGEGADPEDPDQAPGAEDPAPVDGSPHGPRRDGRAGRAAHRRTSAST